MQAQLSESGVVVKICPVTLTHRVVPMQKNCNELESSRSSTAGSSLSRILSMFARSYDAGDSGSLGSVYSSCISLVSEGPSPSTRLVRPEAGRGFLIRGAGLSVLSGRVAFSGAYRGGRVISEDALQGRPQLLGVLVKDRVVVRPECPHMRRAGTYRQEC